VAGLLYTTIKHSTIRLHLSKPSKHCVAIITFCTLAAALLCLACSLTPDSIPLEDYAKHEAILHDLIMYPWPTTYFSEETGPTILRYSFAYYLVPASLSKIFGASYAHFFLYAWNTIGIAIFFMYAASLAKTHTFAYIAVPIIALFSGLDVLYFAYSGYSIEAFSGTIVDAWSRSYSCGWLIGSNSFSLRWSPQHTVAAFLSSCIIHHYWSKPKLFHICALTASILILWSPFIAVSFGALLLVKFVNDRSEVKKELFSFSTATVFLVAALCATFILADPQGVPAGLCSGREGVASVMPEYALFILMEFGIILILAIGCKLKAPSIVLASVVLMCILPFIQVGAANDLQMRGSEIPMCIVGFFVLQALQARRSLIATTALTIAVIIGMISGAQEILRSVNTRINDFTWTTPIYAVNWDKKIPGVNYQVTSQYMAKIQNKSSADFILKRQPHAAELGDAIQISNASNWSKFGKAEFAAQEKKITSESATDAALFSEPVDIPKGIYRIEALMSWNATGEVINGYENAAHLSILGLRKLVSIQNSKAENRRITIYTTFSGEPSRIAFGLGGWAKGAGFVQLNSIKITRVGMSN
jgi:hypothetical protein